MVQPGNMTQEASWLPLFLIVVFLAAAVLLVYLGVTVLRLRRMNEHFRKEKQAVFAFLNKIGEQMGRNVELDAVLREIVSFLIETTRAQAGAVFLLDEERRQLRARVLVGLFPPFTETTEYALTKTKYLHERMKRDPIPVGETLIGEVAARGESVLIENARADARVPQAPGLEIETLLAVPLLVEGRIEGVFALVNRAGNQPFTETDLSGLRALAEQASLTIQMVRLYDTLSEQQRIDQELRVAEGFQRMLLPKECPRIPGIEIAAASRPAREVGGDFYDFFWLCPDRLGIVIADVAGKGIPGALIMSMVRSVVRAESIHAQSPRTVLERVNRTLLSDTRDSVFVTMILAVLDLTDKTLTFARAGHEPLVAYSPSNGGMRLLTPEGIAVGLVDEQVFSVIQEQEIPLHAGDVFVLYTDGIVEALDRNSREYGQERFLEAIRANAEQPAGELVDTLVQEVRQFARGGRQSDDITLVVAKINRLEDRVNASHGPAQEGNVETL